MTRKFDYDFIVIGGGSAGYQAARTAVERGMKTAVVESARRLGGLCILRGCMPSKTLIHVADVLHQARQAGRLGLEIPAARADMRAVQARKRRIIAEFARERVAALESGRFDLFRHSARFRDATTLDLGRGKSLRARHFLIATGSRVAVPPVPGLAELPFWTSDEVLGMEEIPASVIVLGGGVVACEMAQLLARLGSRVTVVQRGSHLLSGHSAEASAVVSQAFRDEGIALFTGTSIRSIRHGKAGFSVRFEQDGRPVTRRAERLLNALGRMPATQRLDPAAAGVETRADGGIPTNRWQQSNVPHIYAAGDCTGPNDVVHLAVAQGELAVRHAAGESGLQPVASMPLLGVVFTDPAVATIGEREGELREKGAPFLKASHAFSDHGKSLLMEAGRGHATVLADPRTGRLLGAEIVGRDAGEMIHCFTGPLALKATADDLVRAPWYHPTLAEILTYPLEEIARRVSR
jgi:pyruvate/2-oxoglutarate dehydrogenase complex dihydrolipoamide dehydrogenase (E3) component